MSGVLPYLDPGYPNPTPPPRGNIGGNAGIIGLLQPTDGSVFTNYMIEYNAFRFGGGYNGVSFKEVDGLDVSTMRFGDSGRPRDNGQFVGYDLMGGRDLVFKGDVQGGGTPNPTYTLQQNMNVISSVFLPQANIETPLYIYLPGQAASYMDTIVHGGGGIMNPPILGVSGRPRNRSWKVDVAYALGGLAQDIQLEVHCTDPRFYQYPTLTKYFENSPATVTNNGNWDCRPIVYLMSPPGSGVAEVVSPSLQINNNVMTWGNQIFNTGFLIVDLYNQTVTQYGMTTDTRVAHCSTIYSGGGTHLTALSGSFTLVSTATHSFDNFTSSGQAYLQTNEGLATFSYTGRSGTNQNLTGCQFHTGNFGATPSNNNTNVVLVQYGMILQDAAGGIQLAQNPYAGALQPGPGGWSATNFGSLLPGDNTIKSSNCFGVINWASAWIL